MQYVDYTVADRIATITLNRPGKRNALSHELIAELKDSFRQAEGDDAVKVIILRAAGDAFCAGADLAYLQQLRNFTHAENVADSTHLKELYLQMYTLSKVIIAQVQGHALAGGCGLAGVCDFVYAVPEARFGYTEVKIGFIPAIVMVFLLRKLGEAQARQLLLRGDLISAEEARRIGLVTTVVPSADQLASEVMALAQHLCRTNSASAMAMTKQMMARVPEMPLEAALAFAAERNADARASADCRRGMDAFLNKEKILW
jgi:methylglutaconyl-CoA hydratase